ncbi:MAG TPA: cytochrome C [Burkholderiales bacterium]|nr:cytochrome C [Burkholderiales bacterium]
MRKILIATAAGFVMALFQSATYAAAEDDMKAAGCLNCHEADKKKVGPSFKDISAKYKGKADEAMAGMKSKPVHKAPLAKTNDAALKGMIESILK